MGVGVLGYWGLDRPSRRPRAGILREWGGGESERNDGTGNYEDSNSDDNDDIIV